MISLSKWSRGSCGQGYVGTFIPCNSTVAPSVFPQSPPTHGLLPAPSRVTSTNSGTHGIGHTGTWFGWKLSLQGKIILAQRRILPLCVSQKRGSLYNPSHAHSPVETFCFSSAADMGLETELLIWTLVQTGFITLYQECGCIHSTKPGLTFTF